MVSGESGASRSFRRSSFCQKLCQKLSEDTISTRSVMGVGDLAESFEVGFEVFWEGFWEVFWEVFWEMFWKVF